MAIIPGSTLSPASDAELGHLSAMPEIVAHLEQLHDLVLSVCPECLIQQRNDDALIYVPPARRDAGRDKNLLTMWAKETGVLMRIMPDPGEMYDPGNRTAYLTRLQRLLAKMDDITG